MNIQVQPNVPYILLTKCTDLCFLYAASDLLPCLCFRSYRRQHTILRSADFILGEQRGLEPQATGERWLDTTRAIPAAPIFYCDPGGTRTHDPLIKSEVLLPTELPSQITRE